MKKFLYEYRGYLGDIFNNDFKITSKVTNTKMEHISNSALKATMEANIGIKTAAAVPLGRVLDMATVKIYQSILLWYSEYNLHTLCDMYELVEYLIDELIF